VGYGMIDHICPRQAQRRADGHGYAVRRWMESDQKPSARTCGSKLHAPLSPGSRLAPALEACRARRP
jgi:hypothetical protein